LSSDVSGNISQWNFGQGFEKKIIVEETDGIPISFFQIHKASLHQYILFLSQGFELKMKTINIENGNSEEKVEWVQSLSSTITGIECTDFGKDILLFVSEFNGTLTKFILSKEDSKIIIDEEPIEKNPSQPIWGLALSPNKFQLSILVDVPGTKTHSYSFISKKKTKIFLYDLYNGKSPKFIADSLSEIGKQNHSYPKDDILNFISKLSNQVIFEIIEYLENSEYSNNMRLSVSILKSIDPSSSNLVLEKLNKFQQVFLLNYATQKIHKLDDKSVLYFCDWILKYIIEFNDFSEVNKSRLLRIESVYKKWKGNEKYSEIVSVLMNTNQNLKDLGIALPKRCKCPLCDEEMETILTLNQRKCSLQHPSEIDVLTFKVIQNKSMKCTGCSSKCEYQKIQNQDCPLCGNKFVTLSWQ
jgi:hypothetical protein